MLTHSDPPEWHPADTELKHACKRAAQICEEANVDIASLAILFAMSNPSIPCTILGIKDRQQLKIAVDLANRFQVDEGSTSATSQEEVLESVLDEAELRAHQRLNDAVGGPFADVWNKGGIVYQWDGVSCAHAFWKDIEGAELIEWQRRQT
uniref:NADP-dependent oxidoreductase domain-containing protein n=1 Tax=Craspedostauros australis TaxID=1486917 RepID=A0A7R9WVK4_9STRA